MPKQLQLGDLTVDVVLKDIKNVHLSVYPPTGRVRISAPKRMSMENIRAFAISKLGWIKQQRGKLSQQERETHREYIDGESHYVWGKRYLLKVAEAEEAPSVELTHKHLLIKVRPGATEKKKREIVESWYREEIRKAAPTLITKWEPVLGVTVQNLFVQKMKTKWGGCNSKTRNVRLNTDLAKKPLDCLKYVLFHEMVHILEPTHNARFVGLMDRFMPNWQFYRDELNTLPVSHEHWSY